MFKTRMFRFLALFALLFSFVASTSIAQDSSSGGNRPTKVQPGESATLPDGMKLENIGTTGDITVVYVKDADGKETWTVNFPAGGKGRADGSGPKKDSGDNSKGKLKVEGEVDLKDVGGSDIDIAKGGKANCDDCDNNNITNGGELTGKKGGNDNNTVKNRDGGEVNDFRGDGNKIS